MASYLGRFTSRGYFPKELPPCFSTDSFHKVVSAAQFAPPFQHSKYKSAEIGLHSLARNPIRRMLGVPNPILYLPLAKIIASHWGEIGPLTTSDFSISAPDLRSKTGRAAGPSTRFKGRATETLLRRKHARYSGVTDIAECYKSFYTHSIPWAMYGKAEGKRRRFERALLGNELDKCLRNCQSEQTNGFPIGPDTSFVLAELVLAAMDREIVRTLNDAGVQLVGGLRFFDDYELMTMTHGDAEIALRVAQKVFLDFGLHPQGTKTSVRELPQKITDSWSTKIRKHLIRPGSTQESDLLELHDLASELSERTTDSVFAYAVKRLAQTNIAPSNHRLALRISCQGVGRDGSSMPHLAQFLVNLVKSDTVIDPLVEDLREFLGETIVRHSQLNHGFEVAWALWTAISFKIELTEEVVAKALMDLDDPFAAILSMHAWKRKLVSIDPGIWQHRMTEDELYGPWWPFVYEMWAREWLTAPQLRALETANPQNFAFLKRNGVKFYTEIRKPYKPRDVTVDWSVPY